VKPIAVHTLSSAALALAMTAVAAAPAAADMTKWKATAQKMGTFLPKIPAGWKATKLITSVSNSAFQKHILARRVYRTIKSEGVDTQINIFIQGSPGWKKKGWTFPCHADRTSKKCAKFEQKTIGGHQFLIQKRRENLSYRTHLDGGRITILFAGKWAKASHIEPFVKRINYKSLAKLR